MSDLIQTTPIALPEARVSIRIRPGTIDDLVWIDTLQKQHSKQLGFMNRPTLEGKVALGHVLVAEAVMSNQGQGASSRPDSSSLAPRPSLLAPVPAGYLIGNDRYQHRDELGVIFQMCVKPEFRRSLVAGNLLRAQFERSAYGCRLYCCWCAQDIEANRFWESMGFVPIAFRAGSEKRGRVHIFWQKRIRAGDTTTPWWFPSVTSGGMMDAARIALPIPPGMTWRDELPRLVPTEESEKCKAMSDESTPRKALVARRSTPSTSPAPTAVPGKLWFGVPKLAIEEKPKRVKPKRVKTVDPTLASRARELRDRWCERASEVGIAPGGKYDTTRAIEQGTEPKRLAA